MEEKWCQIEIEDEAALSGPSLIRLLRTLADALPVRAVVVTGAEGAGPDFVAMFPKDGVIELDMSEFVSRASRVVQFDWGDFHLLGAKGELTDLEPTTPYEQVLPRTLATVRAVDDTYFCVYTRSDRAVEEVTRAYPTAKLHARRLQDLDFPY
jgi:hypothetical protein